MDRVYKRYKADPSVPIPERTRRRHQRRMKDQVLRELNITNKRNHDANLFSQSCDKSVSESVSPNTSDETRDEEYADEMMGCDEHTGLADFNTSTTELFSIASSHSTNHRYLQLSEEECSDSDDDSLRTEILNHSEDSSQTDSLDSDDEEDLSFLNCEEFSSQGSFASDGQLFSQDETSVWSANPSLFKTSVQHEDECGEMRDRLCQCSETTQGEALVSLLSLGLRHSLSYKAMIDILKMINVFYQKEVIPASYYYLLKFAEPSRTQEHIHPLCEDCGNYLGRATNRSEMICDCGYRLTSPNKAKNFIMSLGMKEQIRNLFERPGISEALNYRWKREKHCENNLEDIYDGALYREMSKDNMPLSNPNNFSYSFNTDGVAFGSSSHQQLWPIYITVNELPPKLRCKHMLLVGLWVGKSEPDMQVMLQPFVEEANELSSNGVDWMCDDNLKNSKLIPLFSVVDSQARWRMLNHKCFSGYYGCTLCETPGGHTKRGLRFPMAKQVPPERTDASIRSDMVKAFMRRNLPEKKRHYKGCRGPSALLNLKHFNMSGGMPPDSMHMLKGVVQQNLNQILLKLADDEILKISQRILDLQPPSMITRLPRALKDRDKLKCSEYRALLVVYGPVVMHGIVPSKYVGHFCLLSSAMFLLMQQSLSRAQLEHAGKLIVLYVSLYQKYFGEEHMTYNIHLLLHVVKSVINLGPIHASQTCYPYEGKNRYLLQLAKSPFEVARGVARRYSVYNNLPNLCDRFSVSDDVLNFCNLMFFRPLRSAVRSDGAVLLGRGTAVVLSDREREVLHNQVGIDVQDGVLKFQRMVLDGVRYTTTDYNPSHRRDDSGVWIANKPRNNKCRITNIILIEETVIIFAREMVESTDPIWKVGGFALKHITRVREEGQLVALRPCDVGGQCMFMTTEIGTFVTCIPYGCRGD